MKKSGRLGKSSLPDFLLLSVLRLDVKNIDENFK